MKAAVLAAGGTWRDVGRMPESGAAPAASGVPPSCVPPRACPRCMATCPLTCAPGADLAQLIRLDKVDILVELTGHTASNRLGAVARRPAPIQVRWWA